MCPACLMTLAAIAAGTGGAGGLTALVAKKIHDRRASKTNEPKTPHKEPNTKDGVR